MQWLAAGGVGGGRKCRERQRGDDTPPPACLSLPAHRGAHVGGALSGVPPDPPYPSLNPPAVPPWRPALLAEEPAEGVAKGTAGHPPAFCRLPAGTGRGGRWVWFGCVTGALAVPVRPVVVGGQRQQP